MGYQEEVEELRKRWENEDFQRKHALAREAVVRCLRELNGYYIVKTGHGFIRFIESRMKTPESICDKLERKGFDRDFETAVEELNDISGVRCICYSVKEIYWVARQIGKDPRFTILKAKDYIRKPKKNGYESYHIVMEVPVPAHLIEDKLADKAPGKAAKKASGKAAKDRSVRVEVQLRTMIMDAWAGMDNRNSYKKEKELSPEMAKRIEKYAKIGRRLDKLIQRTLEEEVLDV